MLFSSAGLKKTKGGKVIKVSIAERPKKWAAGLTQGLQVVREHYLRTDIYCGSPLAAPEHRGELGGACAGVRRSLAAGPDLEACILSPTPDAYLVIDANVALHQARR